MPSVPSKKNTDSQPCFDVQARRKLFTYLVAYATPAGNMFQKFYPSFRLVGYFNLKGEPVFPPRTIADINYSKTILVSLDRHLAYNFEKSLLTEIPLPQSSVYARCYALRRGYAFERAHIISDLGELPIRVRALSGRFCLPGATQEPVFLFPIIKELLAIKAGPRLWKKRPVQIVAP